MANIIILGGGLTGSLLALKIAKKYHDDNIYLIDNSNDILSSFKPINFDGKKVNNGFHGLEINRSKKLYSFLKKEIRIKFNKNLIKRSLLINEHFIDNTSYNKFPVELKKDLKRKKFQSNSLKFFFKLISGKYKKTLEMISKRYYPNLNNSLKFLIPWFLPNEFNFTSNDEGDKFRLNSKKKKFDFFATPKKNDLFFNMSYQFQKILKSYKNITILKNSSLEIEKNIVAIRNYKGIKKITTNQIFITTMPTFFFKFFNNKEKVFIKKLTNNKKYFVLSKIKLKKNLNIYFSEILCAVKDFIELSRISKLKFGKYKNELLLELIYDDIKINNELFKKKVSQAIKPIIKNNKITNIEKKISRTIFMPSNSEIAKCIKVIDKKIYYFKKKGLNIVYNPNFAPLNMAKTWILSEKFYEKADKYLSR